MSALATFDEVDVSEIGGETLAAIGLNVTWGVEVLTPKGWRPAVGRDRQALRFPGKDAAVQAAVDLWRRTDRAARPAVAAVG